MRAHSGNVVVSNDAALWRLTRSGRCQGRGSLPNSHPKDIGQRQSGGGPRKSPFACRGPSRRSAWSGSTLGRAPQVHIMDVARPDRGPAYCPMFCW